MRRLATTFDLYQILKEEGFQLPNNTSDVELLAPPDGAFQLRITVNCTYETLQILARAFGRIADQGIDNDARP